MKYLSPIVLPALLATLLFIPLQKANAQAPPIIWQRCYGGDSMDVINCVKQTADGGFIAAGSTRSSDGDLAGNGGVKGLWVLKLDATGNIQWEKTYSDTLLGANYIEPTYDGGYILTGSKTIKLHSDGSVAWLSNIFGYVVHQATDSGYIICNDNQPGLVKLHPDGSVDWQKNYSAAGDYVGVYDVCLSSLGDGYMMTGYIVDLYSSPFVAKIDNSGNLVAPIYDSYSHGIGGHIVKTNDGKYLWTSSGTSGFEISKTDDNLTSYWTISSPVAEDLAVTGDNGFVTWGGSNINSYNMTLNKYDTAHTLVWSKQIAGSSLAITKNVLQLASGNYVVCGYISAIDSDITCDHGGRDGWIAELGTNVGVPQTTKPETNIKVYPVPATTKLFVDLPVGYENAVVRLIDVTGKALLEENSNALNRTVDISRFAAGQYLLVVINNGSFNSYKIIHY